MSRKAENARVKAHLNTHLKFRDYFDWESHFWFVKIVNKDKRNIDFDSQTLFMRQNCRMFFSIEVVPDPDDVAVQLVWDVLAIDQLVATIFNWNAIAVVAAKLIDGTLKANVLPISETN